MNPCYSTINSLTKRLRSEAFFKRKLLSLLRSAPITPLKPLQSLYKVPEILQGLMIANRTIMGLYGPLVSSQGHSLAGVDAILCLQPCLRIQMFNSREATLIVFWELQAQFGYGLLKLFQSAIGNFFFEVARIKAFIASVVGPVYFPQLISQTA